jgi:hypothetical protein
MGITMTRFTLYFCGLALLYVYHIDTKGEE